MVLNSPRDPTGAWLNLELVYTVGWAIEKIRSARSGRAFVLGLLGGLAFAIEAGAVGHASKSARPSISSPPPAPVPAVLSSTYLGGTGFEIAWSCAVDSEGNVYVAGDAQAPDFPVTGNAFQQTYADGGQDGFVAKYDRSGHLLWSTFLGGSDWDGVYALAVDNSGNVVVTGITASANFPTTSNAVQGTWSGGDAAFVTVISADGTSILYSTFLGGTQSDGGVPLPTNPYHVLPPATVETIGAGVAVGSDGTIYVVGSTNTIDFPVTSGAAQTLIGGEADGFVARIDPTATGAAGLIYATYLGGISGDFVEAVAVDSPGNAFVTGATQSLNFPITVGAYQTVHAPGTSGFVTKLNPTGSTLIYSTLLSGSQGSSAAAGANYTASSTIAIDADGHAFVDGETNDTDFPTTSGAVQSTNGGANDGFITEIAKDGASLVFSTYLGASEYDGLFGLKIDSAGNIFVGGYTSSRNQLQLSAFQPQFGGFIDCWVAKLSPGGTALLFSSFLGGRDQESIYSIALWHNELYLTGRTASNNFLTTDSAPQKSYGGGTWDVFLTQLNLTPSLDLSIIGMNRLTTGHFLITGQAGPLRPITIEATSSLFTPFAGIGSTSSDATGAFEFDDPDAGIFSQRFYRAIYP